MIDQSNHQLRKEEKRKRASEKWLIDQYLIDRLDLRLDSRAMAILYALVARGSVVLAEFSATATNASVIARQILEKIPGNNDSHVSYSQDRYIFHVKRTDGLTVLCMADDTAGSKLPLFWFFFNCLFDPNFVYYEIENKMD